jgi:hypothetical protein
MTQVAGGSGNPAVLAEFIRVPQVNESSGRSEEKRQSSSSTVNNSASVQEMKMTTHNASASSTSVVVNAMQVDTSALEMVKNPILISQPGKKNKVRHKSAIESARKEKKERCCLICQRSGHNQKKCPIVRQFGGMLTNDLWEGAKWMALLPSSQRNQPQTSNGIHSGVVAVVLKELVLPLSSDLERQWVYVETYNPLDQNMKEAIVLASTLATWSNRGTSSKKRCYLKGQDRYSPPEEPNNTTLNKNGSNVTVTAHEEVKGRREESSASDLDEMQALITMGSQRADQAR